jgi:hypothetical protein
MPKIRGRRELRKRILISRFEAHKHLDGKEGRSYM